MKKVVHINLGGKEFTINNDAYSVLENYLITIENHFSKSEGFEGILYDIEVRMGELFEEDTKHGNIIDMSKLDRVMNTMGRPEDFTDDDEPVNSKKRSTRVKTGKKLFRDNENKVIGGVAAGLSSYFGINDPIFIRLFFVFLFLMGGSGFIAYLIMMIAIPKAETSSDYLAMKGEEINIDNIAKTVQESIIDIKDKFDDFSKGFKTMIF
jgi:phage shock protein PspC (stress-responsive transcriptional regulator)